MLEFLNSIDVSLLYFINHTLSNALFDKIFPFITEVKNWYVAYIILFLILVIKGGRAGRIAAIALILLVTVTDQFSSFFLKNLFARIRPCNIYGDLKVLVTCTESFSFPSSHAVNNFGAAMFFTKIFPRYKWAFIIGAALMAFSRPNVGVHYPSDVIGGGLIGACIGYLFALAVLKLDNLFSMKNLNTTEKI